jgi:hypothetical protein
MAADGQIGLLTSLRIAGGEQSAAFRERARKARAIAARYRGDAASVLIEIADDFDARAARLETQAS